MHNYCAQNENVKDLVRASPEIEFAGRKTLRQSELYFESDYPLKREVYRHTA